MERNDLSKNLERWRKPDWNRLVIWEVYQHETGEIVKHCDDENSAYIVTDELNRMFGVSRGYMFRKVEFIRSRKK